MNKPATDAATAWLLRRQAGERIEGSPEFLAWLENDAHRAAWSGALAMWDSFDAEPDLLLAGLREAALAARPAPSTAKAAWWAIGSALAAAAGVAMMVRGPPATPVADKPQVTLAIATGIGERNAVTLPDGSRVMLDSGTGLTVALYRTHREIALLHGQAYLAVAHDPARPLTVTAMGSSVTDLGTEFDVAAKPQGMQVLLVKGVVAVAAGGRRVQLAPGESYDTSPGARRVEHPDVRASLAWRDGYIEFTSEPLGQAVARMNRYALHPIVLKDRRIAALRGITGRFKAGDTEQFAEALAAIYGLKLVHLPGGAIELRR